MKPLEKSSYQFWEFLPQNYVTCTYEVGHPEQQVRGTNS